MKIRVRGLAAAIVSGAVLLSGAGAWADAELTSKFSNRSSIANTRHNLTQRQASGGGPSGVIMDLYRNDYGEVCVYCHTPHGANTNVTLPLWNRTIRATSYTTCAALGTSSLTQPVSQPGPNSLACLSCILPQQQCRADADHQRRARATTRCTPSGCKPLTAEAAPPAAGGGGAGPERKDMAVRGAAARVLVASHS